MEISHILLHKHVVYLSCIAHVRTQHVLLVGYILGVIYISVPVTLVTLSGISSSLVENIATALTCVTSESNPAPVVTWYVRGQVTPPTSPPSQSPSGDSLIVVTSTLSFTPVRTDNRQQNVYCTASNGFGDVTSDKPLLNIHCKYIQSNIIDSHLEKVQFHVNGDTCKTIQNFLFCCIYPTRFDPRGLAIN
jgi:hypothetical protein